MTNEFKIEKGIPLTETRGPKIKYPFSKMEIGDSFFLTENERGRVSSAACIYAKGVNKKFSLRKVDGGVRCWRVA